jgi:hypothetical protein
MADAASAAAGYEDEFGVIVCHFTLLLTMRGQVQLTGILSRYSYSEEIFSPFYTSFSHFIRSVPDLCAMQSDRANPLIC